MSAHGYVPVRSLTTDELAELARVTPAVVVSAIHDTETPAARALATATPITDDQEEQLTKGRPSG